MAMAAAAGARKSSRWFDWQVKDWSTKMHSNTVIDQAKVWYCTVFYLFAKIQQHGSRIGITASCHTAKC
jgi:hypothetical protein